MPHPADLLPQYSHHYQGVQQRKGGAVGWLRDCGSSCEARAACSYSSAVMQPSVCTPFKGSYAILLAPSPSPSPRPAASGGQSGQQAYLFFLLVLIPVAALACRCFCCQLERSVTGAPVRSGRHGHMLQYTETRDPFGDSFNSLNYTRRSRGVYTYSVRHHTCVHSPA
jgi:hypothetical protein